jgi:hypothetical protein
MSLFSSIILPKIEEELALQEPIISEFLIKQIHNFASDVLDWAQLKVPSLEATENN